jgi:hypothetical protein
MSLIDIVKGSGRLIKDIHNSSKTDGGYLGLGIGMVINLAMISYFGMFSTPTNLDQGGQRQTPAYNIQKYNLDSNRITDSLGFQEMPVDSF